VKEYKQFLCYTPESESVEFSGKHSFTLYPSLDPYGQNHRQRNTLILVGLATLMDSSRLILVGLATLTGSSRLILVRLATLTGSSRLILVGLGNLRFLQEKNTYVNHLILNRCLIYKLQF
jgi:hypothetical protein